MSRICVHAALALALCVPLTTIAHAQVRPYGRVYGGRRARLPEQQLQGKILAVTPRGLQVEPDEPLLQRPQPKGQQATEGTEQPKSLFLPLSGATVIQGTVQVADPALVLRPGAIVELSGELESASGPISTGGLTVLMGRPAIRPGQPNPLAPNARVTRGALPTDPATIWLRGRIASVSPVVTVVAGRYRFPLRLSDSPRIMLRIYGRQALALAEPGAEVTATLTATPRGGIVVSRVTIRRTKPLSAEELQKANLQKAAKRPRSRPRRRPKQATEKPAQKDGGKPDTQDGQ